MPRESRIFVKTGLLYLALTFAFGGVLLTLEVVGKPLPHTFAIEHAHFGAVGWLVNTVIGIAWWMLPLNRERFPSTQGRYPSGIVYGCFILLNGGLALRLIAEPRYELHGGSSFAAACLLVAAVALPLSLAVFVIVAWQRVRGPSHPAPGLH
jgi:hypothetical protein